MQRIQTIVYTLTLISTFSFGYAAQYANHRPAPQPGHHNSAIPIHKNASKTVLKAHEAIIQSTHTQHLTRQATIHAKKSAEYARKSEKLAKKSAKFARKAKKHAEQSAQFAQKASRHTRKVIGNNKKIMRGTINSALTH